MTTVEQLAELLNVRNELDIQLNSLLMNPTTSCIDLIHKDAINIRITDNEVLEDLRKYTKELLQRRVEHIDKLLDEAEEKLNYTYPGDLVGIQQEIMELLRYTGTTIGTDKLTEIYLYRDNKKLYWGKTKYEEM